MILHIYTDGAARGNPGPAGAGAVLQVQNSEFPPIRRAGKVQSWRFKKFLGDTTNNKAEYQALILALCKARELIGQNNFAIDKIICYSDSELLIKQLRREYKVKDKILGSLFVKIYNMSQDLPPIQYRHIQREKNKEADRLANKAIDKFNGTMD
ncbi:MAG: ribonuclease HI family protein [Patescibacteria group bacterium]